MDLKAQCDIRMRFGKLRDNLVNTGHDKNNIWMSSGIRRAAKFCLNFIMESSKSIPGQLIYTAKYVFFSKKLRLTNTIRFFQGAYRAELDKRALKSPCIWFYYVCLCLRMNCSFHINLSKANNFFITCCCFFELKLS